MCDQKEERAPKGEGVRADSERQTVTIMWARKTECVDLRQSLSELPGRNVWERTLVRWRVFFLHDSSRLKLSWMIVCDEQTTVLDMQIHTAHLARHSSWEVCDVHYDRACHLLWQCFQFFWLFRPLLEINLSGALPGMMWDLRGCVCEAARTRAQTTKQTGVVIKWRCWSLQAQAPSANRSNQVQEAGVHAQAGKQRHDATLTILQLTEKQRLTYLLSDCRRMLGSGDQD